MMVVRTDPSPYLAYRSMLPPGCELPCYRGCFRPRHSVPDQAKIIRARAIVGIRPNEPIPTFATLREIKDFALGEIT